jgi:hypothetical protein
MSFRTYSLTRYGDIRMLTDGFEIFTFVQLRESYIAEFPEESISSIMQAIDHALSVGTIWSVFGSSIGVGAV